MKKIIAATSLLTAIVGITGPALADQYVDGYYRSNGTYVDGYYRSSPNSSRFDNFSSTDNYNPYTGERGYQNPYSDYSSPYSNPYYYGY